jgi:putative Mg2+ transporter-C (MgtC) family protein
LQGLAGCGLILRCLESNDLEGSARVVVTAFTTASQRVDAEVEKIVGRLSLEPTVSAARWQAEARIEYEFPPPPEFGGSPSGPGREDGTATT